MGEWIALSVLAGVPLTGWLLSKPAGMLWVIVLLAAGYPRTLEQFFPVGNSTSASLAYLTWVLTLVGLTGCAVRGKLWLIDMSPIALVLIPIAATGLHAFDVDLSTDFLPALSPLVTVGLLLIYVRVLSRQFPDDHARLLDRLPWVGIAVLLLAAYQYSTGSWGFWEGTSVTGTSIAFDGRAAASFGHATIFGTFEAVCAVLALQRQVRLAWLLWPALTAGAVFSGSRTAVLAVLAGTVLLLIRRQLSRRGLRRVPPRTAWITGLAALFIVVSFAPLYYNALSSTLSEIARNRFADVSGSESFVAHDDRVELAWRVILQDPGTLLFGSGPNAANRYLEQFGTGDSLAVTFDNTFLTLWINYGVLGLTVIAAAAVAEARRDPSMIPTMTAVTVALYAFDVQDWLVMLVLVALAFGSSSQLPAALRDPRVGNGVESNPRGEKLERSLLI